jgi:FkbM family methyltransferase
VAHPLDAEAHKREPQVHRGRRRAVEDRCGAVTAAVIQAQACSPGRSFGFEGILGEPVSTIENLNQNAQAFLPYNPTLIEIGAHEGTGTLDLARTYPYGRIYAFEPNPRAFAVLSERVHGQAHVVAVNLAFATAAGEATLHLRPGGEDRDASLLEPRRRSGGEGVCAGVRVRCATVDEWCRQRGLTRVEFLRLDAGGFELQILQRSRTLLETTLVVVTKTYRHKPRAGIVSYPILRLFLEMAGFELLSHWYQEEGEGEAVFLRKALYDSLFR